MLKVKRHYYFDILKDSQYSQNMLVFLIWKYRGTKYQLTLFLQELRAYVNIPNGDYEWAKMFENSRMLEHLFCHFLNFVMMCQTLQTHNSIVRDSLKSLRA